MKSLILLIALLGFYGCSEKPKDTKADKELAQRMKAINIDENLKMLEIIPKEDFGKRIQIYTKLLSYDANNSEYKRQLAFNQTQLKKIEAEAKKEIARLNKEKEEELKKIEAKAKQEADRLNTAKEKEILRQLKKIPTKQYTTNRNLYDELVRLNPDNKKYKEKLAFYTKKHNEKKAYFGKKPKRSDWDGSYSEVETYLKQTAHDPSSIKFENCSKVYMGENGYLVACVYRGKNAFGALVKNAHWFTIVQSRVIKVEDINTYKLN